MTPFAQQFFSVFLVCYSVWARQGMTIDKLECSSSSSLCLGTQCGLTVAVNDPFLAVFSFGCNMTKSCSSVFVRVRNYVKLKSTYNQAFDVKLDVCAVTAGAKHPIIQTFLGTEIYENLEKYKLICPWGPGVFQVANFSNDGSKRENFGLKRTGRYRAELEFTCGQNSPLFTLKFHGKRTLITAD